MTPRGLDQAFDEIRFGPDRTLNLRATLPTVLEATRRAESWLRERQVAKAGEVLVITGRGAGSEGGVSVVREGIVRLFTILRKSGVIDGYQEHTAGSFVVALAPVTALFEGGRRSRRRSGPPPVVVDPGALHGLDPATRDLLRALAERALDALGVQARPPRLVEDEMRRQFTALAAGVPEGAGRESRLRDAVRTAILEFDER